MDIRDLIKEALSYKEVDKKDIVKIGKSLYIHKDYPDKVWKVEKIDGKEYIVAPRFDDDLGYSITAGKIPNTIDILRGNTRLSTIFLDNNTNISQLLREASGKAKVISYLPEELFINLITKEIKRLSTQFKLIKTAAENYEIDPTLKDNFVSILSSNIYSLLSTKKDLSKIQEIIDNHFDEIIQDTNLEQFYTELFSDLDLSDKDKEIIKNEIKTIINNVKNILGLTVEKIKKPKREKQKTKTTPRPNVKEQLQIEESSILPISKILFLNHIKNIIKNTSSFIDKDKVKSKIKNDLGIFEGIDVKINAVLDGLLNNTTPNLGSDVSFIGLVPFILPYLNNIPSIQKINLSISSDTLKIIENKLGKDNKIYRDLKNNIESKGKVNLSSWTLVDSLLEEDIDYSTLIERIKTAQDIIDNIVSKNITSEELKKSTAELKSFETWFDRATSSLRELLKRKIKDKTKQKNIINEFNKVAKQLKKTPESLNRVRVFADILSSTVSELGKTKNPDLDKFSDVFFNTMNLALSIGEIIGFRAVNLPTIELHSIVNNQIEQFVNILKNKGFNIEQIETALKEHASRGDRIKLIALKYFFDIYGNGEVLIQSALGMKEKELLDKINDEINKITNMTGQYIPLINQSKYSFNTNITPEEYAEYDSYLSNYKKFMEDISKDIKLKKKIEDFIKNTSIDIYSAYKKRTNALPSGEKNNELFGFFRQAMDVYIRIKSKLTTDYSNLKSNIQNALKNIVDFSILNKASAFWSSFGLYKAQLVLELTPEAYLQSMNLITPLKLNYGYSAADQFAGITKKRTIYSNVRYYFSEIIFDSFMECAKNNRYKNKLDAIIESTRRFYKLDKLPANILEWAKIVDDILYNNNCFFIKLEEKLKNMKSKEGIENIEKQRIDTFETATSLILAQIKNPTDDFKIFLNEILTEMVLHGGQLRAVFSSPIQYNLYRISVYEYNNILNAILEQYTNILKNLNINLNPETVMAEYKGPILRYSKSPKAIPSPKSTSGPTPTTKQQKSQELLSILRIFYDFQRSGGLLINKYIQTVEEVKSLMGNLSILYVNKGVIQKLSSFLRTISNSVTLIDTITPSEIEAKIKSAIEKFQVALSKSPEISKSSFKEFVNKYFSEGYVNSIEAQATKLLFDILGIDINNLPNPKQIYEEILGDVSEYEIYKNNKRFYVKGNGKNIEIPKDLGIKLPTKFKLSDLYKRTILYGYLSKITEPTLAPKVPVEEEEAEIKRKNMLDKAIKRIELFESTISTRNLFFEFSFGIPVQEIQKFLKFLTAREKIKYKMVKSLASEAIEKEKGITEDNISALGKSVFPLTGVEKEKYLLSPLHAKALNIFLDDNIYKDKYKTPIAPLNTKDINKFLELDNPTLEDRLITAATLLKYYIANIIISGNANYITFKSVNMNIDVNDVFKVYSEKPGETAEKQINDYIEKKYEELPKSDLEAIRFSEIYLATLIKDIARLNEKTVNLSAVVSDDIIDKVYNKLKLKKNIRGPVQIAELLEDIGKQLLDRYIKDLKQSNYSPINKDAVLTKLRGITEYPSIWQIMDIFLSKIKEVDTTAYKNMYYERMKDIFFKANIYRFLDYDYSVINIESNLDVIRSMFVHIERNNPLLTKLDNSLVYDLCDLIIDVARQEGYSTYRNKVLLLTAFSTVKRNLPSRMFGLIQSKIATTILSLFDLDAENNIYNVSTEDVAAELQSNIMDLSLAIFYLYLKDRLSRLSVLNSIADNQTVTIIIERLKGICDEINSDLDQLKSVLDKYDKNRKNKNAPLVDVVLTADSNKLLKTAAFEDIDQDIKDIISKILQESNNIADFINNLNDTTSELFDDLDKKIIEKTEPLIDKALDYLNRLYTGLQEYIKTVDDIYNISQEVIK